MLAKLISEIEKKDAPVVVGLDPTPALIPEKVKKISVEESGETLEGLAEAYFEFNSAIIDAVADLVPAVKPQIAMYEQLGLPGLKAFAGTVEYAHDRGLIVIGDAKRGDIGSTSAAYASAHIGTVEVGGTVHAAFDEDFVTVNPYLGTDGVKPFIDICNENDRGIFVLVKTSNPSSGEFQDKIADGRPIYEWVAEKVNEWGQQSMDGAYSNIGAVCGATYPEMGAALRRLMPKNYILVPGYGAQGGSGADLKPFFNSDGLGAIVNSSRGIIGAWQKEEYAKFGDGHFEEAARQAVIDMLKDIRENR